MIAALLLACGDGVSPPGGEAAPAEREAPAAMKIVSVSPAMTEVLLALEPTSLVGVDSASAELPGARDLPSVGFGRRLGAEGVLSLGPTHLFADETAGPPNVLDQVEAAGVTRVTLPHERSPDGVRAMILSVGEAIGRDASGLVADFEKTCGSLPQPGEAKRAMFVYARGAGSLQVSGTDTAAHAMLGLAGLENAVTAYDGYKPLTPEAALAADPDWIVFTTRGLDAAGGEDGVKDIVGLAPLAAVAEGRIASVDDFTLLAFGLGTCEGARALAEQVAGR